MNAMSEALHAVDVITRVRERLEAEGADAELFRLRRFSSDELQILVRLELGLDVGMYGIPDRYKNARVHYVRPAKPQVKRVPKARRSPASPQGRRGTVAA